MHLGALTFLDVSSISLHFFIRLLLLFVVSLRPIIAPNVSRSKIVNKTFHSTTCNRQLIRCHYRRVIRFCTNIKLVYYASGEISVARQDVYPSFPPTVCACICIRQLKTRMSTPLITQKIDDRDKPTIASVHTSVCPSGA